jgi:malonate transporter
MPPFAETILVVFALIAIGYGAAAFRLIKPETGDGLSDFVFTIAVPLLLVSHHRHGEHSITGRPGRCG